MITASADTSSFSLHLTHLPEQPVDLASFAGYFRDSSSQLTYEMLRGENAGYFLPLAGEERPFRENEVTYWVRFELCNDGDDSLRMLVRADFRLDYFDLYADVPSGIPLTARAGFLVALQRLSFPDNYLCLSLAVGPHTCREFFLRMRQDCSLIVEGRLWLSSHRQEETWRREHLLARRGLYNYYFGFFAGMGLLLFLVLILCVYHPREKALIYYGLYVGLVILFYLRNFENWHIDIVVLFKYVREWHYHFELILSYLSYAAYLLFVVYLLDLDRLRPRLAFGLRVLTGLFGGLLAINLLIMQYAGLTAGVGFLESVRITFFFIAVPGLIFLVRRVSGVLAYVVLFGTLVMLLGALLPAFGYRFGGEINRVSHTVWGWVQFPGWCYYFYDFKIGALLESFCFFIGLNYKISRPAAPLPPAPQPAGFAPPPRPVSDFLQQVLALIQVHLADETFGPQQLADALHLSHARMHRRLKEETGRNATELLRDLRLRKACELLRDTDLPVGEIAHRVGFGDPAYFTRVFRREIGVSPRAYRQGEGPADAPPTPPAQ